MSNAAIRQLIGEVLDESRLSRQGCFVSNMAASDLRNLGETALPEIEQFIRRRLVPDSGASKDLSEFSHKHPGMHNLWMSYFQICGEQNLDRIVRFLSPLNGPIPETALRMIKPTWAPNGGPIPGPLVDFAQEVADRESDGAKDAAGFVLRHRAVAPMA